MIFKDTQWVKRNTVSKRGTVWIDPKRFWQNFSRCAAPWSKEVISRAGSL